MLGCCVLLVICYIVIYFCYVIIEDCWKVVLERNWGIEENMKGEIGEWVFWVWGLEFWWYMSYWGSGKESSNE